MLSSMNMTTKIQLFFLAAALLLTGAVFAEIQESDLDKPADPAVDKLLERIQSKYADMKDYQASFTQEAVLRQMGSRETSAGRVYFQVPGKMRWHYTSPEEKFLIADGTWMWLYTPADKQAYRQPFNRAMASRTPVALLSGDADLRAEFEVSVLESEADSGATTLKLVPKIAQPGVSEVLVTVDTESLAIRSTQISDVYGNRTTVSFSNPKINAGLAASRFSFTPPEGVEVISSP